MGTSEAPISAEDEAQILASARDYIEAWLDGDAARMGRCLHVSPQTEVAYHAGLCAPHVRAASFWAIARDDEMPGAEPEIARRVFEAAPEPKQLLAIDGGHFGLLYHPSELFDTVSAAQAAFLVRHLS